MNTSLALVWEWVTFWANCKPKQTLSSRNPYLPRRYLWSSIAYWLLKLELSWNLFIYFHFFLFTVQLDTKPGEEEGKENSVEEQEEEEEVIRCICNIFRDEGLMIQCERCLVGGVPHKFILAFKLLCLRQSMLFIKLLNDWTTPLAMSRYQNYLANPSVSQTGWTANSFNLLKQVLIEA